MAVAPNSTFTKPAPKSETDSPLTLSQFTEPPRLSRSIAQTIVERASLTLAQAVIEALPTFLKRITTCFDRLIVVPTVEECHSQPLLAVRILRELEPYLPTNPQFRKGISAYFRVLESQSAIIYETRACLRSHQDYSSQLVALDRNARTIALLSTQIKEGLEQLIVPPKILALPYYETLDLESATPAEDESTPFEVKDLLEAIPEAALNEVCRDESELKPSEIIHPGTRKETNIRVKNRDSDNLKKEPSGCLNVLSIGVKLGVVALGAALATSIYNFWNSQQDPVGDLLRLASKVARFVVDHPFAIVGAAGALIVAYALFDLLRSFDDSLDSEPQKLEPAAQPRIVRLSDGKGTPSTGGSSPDLDESTPKKLGQSPVQSEATVSSSGPEAPEDLQEDIGPEPDASISSRLAVTSAQILLGDRRTMLDIFAWIDSLPASTSSIARELLINDQTFHNSYDPSNLPANQTEMSIYPGDPVINLPVPTGYEIRGMRFLSGNGEVLSDTYPHSVECCLLGSARIIVPHGVNRIDYTVEQFSDSDRWKKIYAFLLEHLPALHFDPTACKDPGFEALRDLNCSPTEKGLLAMKLIKSQDLIWCSDFLVANILHLCKDILPETVLTLRMATCSPMAITAATVMRSLGAPAIAIGGFSLPLTSDNQLNFNRAHEQSCLITPDGPIPFDPTASARVARINGLMLPPRERTRILERAKHLSGKELYSFLDDLRELLQTKANERHLSNSLSSLGYLRFRGEQLLRRIQEGAEDVPEERQPKTEVNYNTIADSSIANVLYPINNALELTIYCTKIARRIRDNPDDPMPALLFIDANNVVPEVQPNEAKFLPEKLQWLDTPESRKRFLADIAIDLSRKALITRTIAESEKQDVAIWLANKIDNIDCLAQFRFVPNGTAGIPRSYTYQPDFFPSQQMIRIFDELTPLLSNDEFCRLTSCFFGRLKRGSEHEEFSGSGLTISEVNLILNSIKREVVARELRISSEDGAFWIQNFARIPPNLRHDDLAIRENSRFLKHLCASSSSGIFVLTEALSLGIPAFKRATAKYASNSNIQEEIESLSPEQKIRLSRALGRSILRYFDDGYSDLGRHLNYLAKLGIKPDLSEIKEELLARLAEFTATIKDSPMCFNYPSEDFPASRFVSSCPQLKGSTTGEFFHALRAMAELCTGFEESDLISIWPKVDEVKLAAYILSGFQITFTERENDSRIVYITFRPPGVTNQFQFEASNSKVIRNEVVVNSLLLGLGASESIIKKVRLLPETAVQEPILSLLDRVLHICPEQLALLKGKFLNLSDGLKVDLVVDTLGEKMCGIHNPELLRALYTIICSRGREVRGLKRFDYLAIESPPEDIAVGSDVFGKPISQKVAFTASLLLELSLQSNSYGYPIVERYLRNQREIPVPLLAPVRLGLPTNPRSYWDGLFCALRGTRASSLSRSQFARIIDSCKQRVTNLARRHQNPYQTFQIHHFGHVIVPSELGDLRELRDYMNSDRTSAIDWRSSARANRLMVRSYQEQEVRNLHLIYDAELLAGELAGENQETPEHERPFFENLLLHLVLAQRSGMPAKLTVVSRGWKEEIEFLAPNDTDQDSRLFDFGVWRDLARTLRPVQALSEKERAVSSQPLGYNILSANSLTLSHSDISIFALAPHNARRASGTINDLRRGGFFIEILRARNKT